MIERRLLMGGGGSFPTPPAYTTVAQSGARSNVRTGTAYKAFPGMCIDAGGTWHAVYRNGTNHNSAGASIDYITSTDDGANWDPPGSATILYLASGSNDARDPFIMETSSGRLLVGYDHRDPYNSLNITAYLIYSDDGGSTWSSEYAVPSSFSAEIIVTSQAIELPSGAILIPGFGRSSGFYTAVVWRSTDDGASVSSQTTIASGTHDWEEPQVRLLQSGRIIALIRDSAGSVTYRSVSSDNGVTWSAPTSVLTGGGRPDFVEIAPGLLFLTLRATNADDTPKWTYSTDEGATWAALANVDAGTEHLMYSAPVVTSIGNAAVLYSLENSSSDADLYLRHYVAA